MVYKILSCLESTESFMVRRSVVAFFWRRGYSYSIVHLGGISVSLVVRAQKKEYICSILTTFRLIISVYYIWY